jgi:Flp pilus assembly protein TadD
METSPRTLSASRGPAGRRTRGRGRPPADRALALGAAAACLLVAAYLGIQRREEVRLRDANALGVKRDYAGAEALARRVTRPPALTRALLVRARASAALGRHRVASRAYARAAARDPENWALRREWAISLLVLGDRVRARREIERSLALNPRTPLPRGFRRDR